MAGRLGISSIGFEIWAGPATVTVEAFLGETLVKRQSFALAPATQIGVGNFGVVTLTVPGTLLVRYRFREHPGRGFCAAAADANRRAVMLDDGVRPRARSSVS